jgi:site-specific recombinase XerD
MLQKNTKMTKEQGPVGRYAAHLREQEVLERTAKRRIRRLWELADALGGEGRLLTASAEEILPAALARFSRSKGDILEWYTDAGAFYRFLVREGLRKDNPLEKEAEGAKAGGRSVRRTGNLGLEFGQLRDDVILTLLRETDIRPEELCLLTVKGYDRAQARLTPEPERRVLLNEFAAWRLEEYLDVLSGYVRLRETTPLFIQTGAGAALPESHYWSLIRRDLRLADTEAPAPALAASH